MFDIVCQTLYIWEMSQSAASLHTKNPSEDSKRAILVDAGLFIEDPTSYPGLLTVLDPVSGLDLDFNAVAYDTSVTTQEKVRCSVCPHRQRHNHGFIVKLKSGDVGLVGRNCGENHFFGDGGWDALKAKTLRVVDEALVAARWGTAKHNIDQTVGHLRKWSRDLKAVSEIGALIAQTFPKLVTKIRRNLKDGRLEHQREILVPRVNVRGELEENREFVSDTIVRIEADWFFRNEDLSLVVKRQIDLLRKVEGDLRPDMTSMNISACRRTLREANSVLSDIATKQAELVALFKIGKWHQIAEWARLEKVPPADYHLEGKVLRCTNGTTVYAELPLPELPTKITSHWNSVEASWPTL